MIIKFVENTTVIRLILEGDEADYNSEIERLAAQSPENNLNLNTLKIKKMVVEFQRNV